MMTDIFNNNYSPQPKFGDLDLEFIRAPVWVNCDISASIGESYGVSSITDVGTGQIGVNFIRAFATTTSFVGKGTGQVTIPTNVGNCSQTQANISTSRCDFVWRDVTSVIDPVRWNAIVIGEIL